VGCGIAMKTWESSHLMQIPNGNTYGIDLSNGWINYAKPKEYLLHPDSGGTAKDGVKLRYYEADGSFPFADGEFDVISCYMVLHHLREDEREVMMREIRRCLSDNGTLIIREHDSVGVEDSALADIEHLMYEVAKTGTSYKQYKEEHYGEYHSSAYWVSTFEALGFRLNHTFPEEIALGPTRGKEFIFTKL